MRLDAWLDIACLVRTRSEAQRACQLGRVVVNGTRAKPHRELHVGDEIVITRPPGRKQVVSVKGFSEHHIARAEARHLYDDLTPPATPEAVELRRLSALLRAGPRPAQAPDKRERRRLRRLKGLDD